MAWKRNFRRKRIFRRKKRFFRKKRRIARPPGGRVTGIQFFKLRSQTSIAVDGTGQNAIKGIRATITDDPNQLEHEQWSHLASLYKFYKVYGIKLEWIPRFTGNEMVPVAQGEAIKPMFILHDWSSTGSSPLPQEDWDATFFLDNLSTKRYPLHRSWSAYYRMRKIYPHIDYQNPNPCRLMGSGFIETGRPFTTQDIKIYTDDIINIGTIAVGTLIVTYYIGMRFRQ